MSKETQLKENFLIWLKQGKNKTQETPQYIMGIDSCNDKIFSFCLMKSCTDGVLDLILSETMTNKKKFTEKVKNLQQYFNAIIMEDKV